uniref:Uncharacterized protein n=1 Tax=Ditylenchus dipsaci TaxID=166011 RepID=A0A915DMV3_9BILA
MEETNKLLQQDFDAYQEQMEQVQTIASHEVDANMLRRNASAADYFYDDEQENSRSYKSGRLQLKSNQI